MEFYLSDILGNPVLNQSREKIGAVEDVVVTDIDKPHPKIHGLVLRRGLNKQAVFVPNHNISTTSTKQIRLSTDVVDLSPFVPKNDEILLSKDVYDKQLVDIDDRRLTRVNDLLLEETQHILFLKGVDISAAGIFRRLRFPRLGIIKRNIIDWEDVQFLGGQLPVKFKFQYKNLETLHPVDIARIIFEGPGYKYGSKVLASLKDPIAADIIEELSPKLQINLIESMKIEDVADVVKHMRPERATDLLVTLGPEFSQKILPLLEKKQSQTIEELLNYPENSTGAFMTTNYIAMPAGITIEQMWKRLREMPQIPDFAYYIFVLENEFSNKLVGVVSSHDLYKAEPRSQIEDVMTKKIIVSSPQDSIRETLKKMYRYDLSALPVISKGENKLLGIVTLRDAISTYLPKRWKVRIRQVFSNGT